MTNDEHRLTIAARFRGPAGSGNGGYTAGSLAEHVGDHATAVEVTLRQPPPLDVAMGVARLRSEDPRNVAGAPTTVLSFGGATIATAHAVEDDLVAVEPVAPDVAAAAEATYPGLTQHPFPTCFSCGTARRPGDGLRIFPGPVPQAPGRTVAATWTPDASLAAGDRVGAGTTWAALDCIGGWTDELEGRPMVLGRMTARVDALPVVGEPHVVMGRQLGLDGRKRFTASTLYDSDQRVVAVATHVWVTVDPEVFNALRSPV